MAIKVASSAAVGAIEFMQGLCVRPRQISQVVHAFEGKFLRLAHLANKCFYLIAQCRCLNFQFMCAGEDLISDSARRQREFAHIPQMPGNLIGTARGEVDIARKILASDRLLRDRTGNRDG